jgi:hypothetical protein
VLNQERQREKECAFNFDDVQRERNITSERRLSAQTHSQMENTTGEANEVKCQGRRSDGVKVDDARPPLYIFTCC